MLIDKSGSMHMSITNGRTREFKSSFFIFLLIASNLGDAAGISFSNLKLLRPVDVRGKTIMYNYRNYRIPFELL